MMEQQIRRGSRPGRAAQSGFSGYSGLRRQSRVRSHKYVSRLGWLALLICLGVIALFGSARLALAVAPAPEPPSAALARDVDKWMGTLRPAGTVPAAEQAAWWKAMNRFSLRAVRDDFTALDEFLAQFPSGEWAVPLRLRLSEQCYLTGHYTRAIETMESVWSERSNPVAGSSGVLYAHAGVKLAELYARLGRLEQVGPIISEVSPLALSAADREVVRSVQQGMGIMRLHPERAFRCGALALERLRVFADSTNAGHQAIRESRSTGQGMSLADLAVLAQETGMSYMPAFRAPGAALVAPSVMHLKAGHFVAVVRERKGEAQIEDPTGWQTSFVSSATLDEESTGYFLVPTGPLPGGWRQVEAKEAAAVWGRNGVLDNDPDGCGPRDPALTCHAGGGGRSASSPPMSHGMATYNVHLMLVSQQIQDTPVGYTPPFGPAVYTTFNHVQRANERFGYRPEWTHDWTGELYEDPRVPLGDIWLRDEGGWERFSPMDEDGTTYQGRVFNVGRLVRTAAAEITWQFPDGTKRIYTTFSPTNVVWARMFLLTGIEDESGNRLSIQALPTGRVESVTDALGQITHFYYELPDPGLPPTSDPNLQPVTSNYDYTNQITRIVDPFGREAKFQYGLSERYLTGYCDGGQCSFGYYNYDLTNIVDVAGMSSQFVYDTSGTFVTQLTTPYGATTFRWTNQFEGSYAIEITDPEGATERVEYGGYFTGDDLWELPKGMHAASRNLEGTVAHWDKKAYAEAYAPGSALGATLYTFQLSETLQSAGRVLECVRPVLESRRWFNYPGQGYPTTAGIGDQPNRIGRVLDDGTTQLWQIDRDSWGNVIRSVDPAGRSFSYIFSTNYVDLLEVRQTRAGQNELVFRIQWDNQHRPIAFTDAAGQTSHCTYNTRGQLTQITDPLGNITSLVYDASGYLVSLDGPLPGTQDQYTFTYDAAGRRQSVTDPDGYVIKYAYDALDRVTQLAFPDTSSIDFTYDRMEVGTVNDRLGRETHYTYDGLRRLISAQDAEGRLTQWHRDLQGRVVAKEYADGSQIVYEYERASSRLKRCRDEKGQITEFDYDAAGELLAQRYVNPQLPTPGVAFSYDPNYPRIASMTDGNGTTKYTYYPMNGSLGAGQLASADGPWNNDLVTYQYDALGRLISRAINGVAVSYGYDAAGRQDQLTNVLGKFKFTFDGGMDRLLALAYPNGQRTEFAYESNLHEHLLQRATHFRPDGTKFAEFTYDYNAMGMLTNWTQLQASRLKTWMPAYDQSGRLTNVSETVSGGSPSSLAWQYDEAGNLASASAGNDVRQFGFDSLNRLAIFTTNTPVAASTLEWDAQNRLAAINNAAGRVEFGYDGLDRRTRITVKHGASIISDRRYLWCGITLCEERDATGATVLKRYSHYGVQNIGAAELPVGNYYYTRDHLDSIREISGASSASFDYSPYGEQQRLAGALPADFAFGGHFNSGNGLALLAPFRAYSPGLARWLSRDPKGESKGLNLYAYAGLDPINRIDPLGWADAPSGLTGWDFIDNLVKQYGPKSVKVGPVNVSVEKPEVFVQVGTDIEADGVKVASVKGECGVGVTTTGGPKDDLFYIRWKFQAKAAWDKIPKWIQDKLSVTTEGETSFGHTDFNPDAMRERQMNAQGVNSHD